MRSVVFDTEKKVFSANTVEGLLSPFEGVHSLVTVTKRKGTAVFSQMYRGNVTKDKEKGFLINGPFGEINITNLVLFAKTDDPSVSKVTVEELRKDFL